MGGTRRRKEFLNGNGSRRFRAISIPKQLKAFALADNRTAEKSHWDADKLDDALAELEGLDVNMEGLGFSDEDMAEIEKELEGMEETEGEERGGSSGRRRGAEIKEQWKVVVTCESGEDQVAFLNQTRRGRGGR